MPVTKPATVPQLQDRTQLSIDDLESLKKQLIDMMAGQLSGVKFQIMASISDIDIRIRALKFTQIHLDTATIGVEFADADIKKLNDLGAKLDASIVAGAQLNAVLNSLPAVLKAAVNISGIIDGHITSA